MSSDTPTVPFSKLSPPETFDPDQPMAEFLVQYAPDHDLHHLNICRAWARAIKAGTSFADSPAMVDAVYWCCSRLFNARWPAAEHVLLTHAGYVCLYAQCIIKGRWLDAESLIMHDVDAAYGYAVQVLKARWPEAEALILSSAYAQAYRDAFDLPTPDTDTTETV